MNAQQILMQNLYVQAHGKPPGGKGQWTFQIHYVTRGWCDKYDQVTFTGDYVDARAKAYAHATRTGPSNARSATISLLP